LFRFVSLSSGLWSAADRSRGHLDTAEYKHIVLGLIFLRFLSTTDDVPLKQMALVLKEEAAASNRKNGHRNGSSVELPISPFPKNPHGGSSVGKHTLRQSVG